MFIKTKPVPEELKSIITKSLQIENVRRPELLNEAMGGGAKQEATLSFPHEAYFMRLDDIVDGKSLDAAYSTGTRVLLSDAKNEVYSAAEIGAQNKDLLLAQFDTGPFLQPMIEAITRFADSEFNGIYDELDMRLLRIPALYIMAVWLHSDKGPVNLLMPIGPTPPPLTQYRPYNGAAFLSQIRGIARERQKQD